MLTQMERLTRAAATGRAVGHPCRLVWQEPSEEWPETPRGYGVAVRLWSEARGGMCEVACFIDEADEQDDGQWELVARALRMAVACEQDRDDTDQERA